MISANLYFPRQSISLNCSNFLRITACFPLFDHCYFLVYYYLTASLHPLNPGVSIAEMSAFTPYKILSGSKIQLLSINQNIESRWKLKWNMNDGIWRMFLPCGERLEVRFRLLFFILVRCSTVISRTSALSTLVPDSVRSGTSTFSSSKHLLIRARLLFSIIGFGILPACKDSGLQLWQIVGWERSQL